MIEDYPRCFLSLIAAARVLFRRRTDISVENPRASSTPGCFVAKAAQAGIAPSRSALLDGVANGLVSLEGCAGNRQARNGRLLASESAELRVVEYVPVGPHASKRRPFRRRPPVSQVPEPSQSACHRRHRGPGGHDWRACPPLRARPEVSCSSAEDKQSRTAHVSSSPRIYYPHLPYVGDSVRLVRSCSNFGPDQVQVELSNGNQVVLPAWILDEDACRVMAIREQALIAVQALLTLRSLLNSQPILVVRDSTTSAVSSTQGGPVEPAKTTVVPVRRKKTRTARRDLTALS